MVGENQQVANRFPFPEGADEESAVRAPYSAIKVVCGVKNKQANWVATRASRPIGSSTRFEDGGLFCYMD